jgi:hypothetical protein
MEALLSIVASAETFTKHLVARFSPPNGCHVDEGKLLTVLPQKRLVDPKPMRHHFVAAERQSVRSRYGWVGCSSEGFTLDWFLATFHRTDATAVQVADHVRRMLLAVRDLPEGTPVAARYVARVLPVKMVEFEARSRIHSE